MGYIPVFCNEHNDHSFCSTINKISNWKLKCRTWEMKSEVSCPFQLLAVFYWLILKSSIYHRIKIRANFYSLKCPQTHVFPETPEVKLRALHAGQVLCPWVCFQPTCWVSNLLCSLKFLINIYFQFFAFNTK